MADVYFRRPDGAVVAIPREQSDAAQTKGYTPLSGPDVENAQYQDRYGRVPTPETPLSQKELFEGVKRGDVTYDYDPRQAANEKLLSASSFGLLGPDRDDPAALYRAQRAEREHPLASGVLEGAAMLGGGAAISALTGGGAALAGGGRLASAAGWAANAVGQGAQAELELSRVEGEEFSPTRAAVIGIVGEVAGHGAMWGISKGIGATRNLVARATRGAVSEQVDRAFKGGIIGEMSAARHLPEHEADIAKRAAEAFDAIDENFDKIAAMPKKQTRIAKQVDAAGDTLAENQGAARIETISSMTKLRDGLLADQQGIAAPPPRVKKILSEVGNVIAELEGGASKGKLWKSLDDSRRALQHHIKDLQDLIDNAPDKAWMSTDGLAAMREAEQTVRTNLLREDTWGKAAADMQRAYNTPFHEKFLPNNRVVNDRFRFSRGKDFSGARRYSGEQGKILNNLIRQQPGGLDPYNQKAAFRTWLEGVEDIAKAGFYEDKKAGQSLLDAVKTLRQAPEVAQMLQTAAESHARRAGSAGLAADAAGAVGGAMAFGPMGAALGGARRLFSVGEWMGRALEHMGVGAEKQSLDSFFMKGAPHWSPAEAGEAVSENALRDILDSSVDDIGKPIVPDRTVPIEPGAPPIRPDQTVHVEGEPMPGPITPDETVSVNAGQVLPDRTVPVTGEPAPRSRSAIDSHQQVEVNEQLDAGPARGDALTRQQFDALVSKLRVAGAKSPTGESLADMLENRSVKLEAQGLLQGEAANDPAGRIREIIGKHKEAGYVHVDEGYVPADLRDMKNLEKRTVSKAIPENSPEVTARVDAWRKKANPNHLDKDAMAVATSWIMTGFEDVNRNPKLQREVVEKLRPLAVANPTADGPLWRGQGLKREQIANLVPGATVQMKNLTSTSVVEAIGGHFAEQAGDTPTLFQIKKAKYGINLNPIHHTEGEVILGPGAYKVTGMGWDESRKMLVVDLEQAATASKSGQRGMLDLEGGKQGQAGYVDLSSYVKVPKEDLVKLNTVLPGSTTEDQLRQIVATDLLGGKLKIEPVKYLGRNDLSEVRVTNDFPGGDISRRFRVDRQKSGDVRSVLHERFFLPDEAQGRGLATEYIRRTFDTYRDLGIAYVDINKAVDIGKYAWLKRGFRPWMYGSEDAAVETFNVWAKNHGFTTAASSIDDIVNSPVGKEFLLNVPGRWNEHLRFQIQPGAKFGGLILENVTAGRMSPGQAIKSVATSPMGIVSGLGAAGVGLKAADDDTREGIGVGTVGLAAGAALWGNRASLFRLFQTQLVKSTARAMFSGARRAAPGLASRAVYTRAALAVRQKEITGWQVSPEEVLSRLQDGLSEAPDDAVAPVAIGTFQALQFLAQRVPRAAKLNAVSAREIPIPESSMREYALFERAALRPKDALEAAQYEGRFAPQTLEAFEQLYPDLLLELRVASVEEIQENGAPPTIQSRLAYAQLFGGDGRIADPAFSPDITAAINAPPAPDQQGGQSPSPPTNRPWQALPSRPAGLQKIS